jgi:exopolyphosphatase/guanosine-5'-triphosphate,3'-diphosphate pyrophosphatase
LKLAEYDSKLIHGARLTRDQVDSVVASLLAMTTRQRDELAVMQPGRADVIAAGALILRSIMARCEATELVVSEHDLLDGIIWSLVQ